MNLKYNSSDVRPPRAILTGNRQMTSSIRGPPSERVIIIIIIIFKQGAISHKVVFRTACILPLLVYGGYPPLLVNGGIFPLMARSAKKKGVPLPSLNSLCLITDRLSFTGFILLAEKIGIPLH